MTEAARYFCDEHLKLLSESQVEKFVCFWCAQNKIAEREQEAATAALEQAARMLAKGSDGVGGDWEAAEAAAAITKPTAIGGDKEDQP